MELPLNHLVGGWATPLKNRSSSIGMIIPHIWENNPNGNQTTNQSSIYRWGCSMEMNHPETPRGICCGAPPVRFSCRVSVRDNTCDKYPTVPTWRCNGCVWENGLAQNQRNCKGLKRVVSITGSSTYHPFISHFSSICRC